MRVTESVTTIALRRVGSIRSSITTYGSSRSRQIMGKALRNALAIAVKRGYIPRNPADVVPIASGNGGAS